VNKKLGLILREGLSAEGNI